MIVYMYIVGYSIKDCIFSLIIGVCHCIFLLGLPSIRSLPLSFSLAFYLVSILCRLNATVSRDSIVWFEFDKFAVPLYETVKCE